MPSPFPGMDPFIEEAGKWGDFHTSLLTLMRLQLNARLPRGLYAEIQQYVWIEEPATQESLGKRVPDAFVARGNGDEEEPASATASADPVTLVLPASEIRQHRYLSIVDNQGNRVITAIELLSPSNKVGAEGRETYLAKRREYLGGGVNLVEIDLLRDGPRLPLGRTRPRIADFYVALFRCWQLPRFGFWTFGLRDPIPEIPVPLDRDRAPTMLSLKPCVDQVYDGGRYGERLPYDRPLTVPPRRGDAAWVRQIAASAASEMP